MKPICDDDLSHILTNTLPLWDAIRGKRVFLSGGTGFFGKWLLESLAYSNRFLKLDCQATVLCRRPEAFREKMPHLDGEPCIQFRGGDVRDFSFPHEDFDYVIHAAAPTGAVAEGEEIQLLDTLLDGTRAMLALAKARKTRKFLFVSSGAVYGRQPADLLKVPESYCGGPAWLEPASVYAEGKRVAEQMCALAAGTSEMEVAIARCFAFVGPHLPLDQHFAIGNFIRDALADRTIAIHGDGTPMRSYLYAADLAIWLWTLLLDERNRRREALAINVGSGQAISIGELARTVANEINPSLKIETASQAIAGAPVHRYVPDVAKAEQLFGLKQTIGLRESIRRTAEWYR